MDERERKAKIDLVLSQISPDKIRPIGELKIQLVGASGIGKAQPLDEPILTSKGWKNMGELTLNDKVIDPVTGDSINILGIYDRGKLPVYRITFSDGTNTRVSKDHLWEVIKKSHGEYKSFVVDTNYLIDNYKRFNGNNWKYPFMIPNTKPVFFEKKRLPLHPYILGFILGDGCISGNKNCSRVSTNIVDSNDVIQRLKTFGAEISLGNDYPEVGVTHFRILGVGVLKDLGLTGCKSKDKFIPEIYLKSSVNDRKLLLAGLLDTDSSTPSGKSKTCINYSTTSSILAEQVAYLLRSLGETASIRKHDRSHEGKSVSYLVHCNISFNPYLRRYKQEILDKNFSDTKRRNHREKRIVDISYIEELPVRCIRVNSERGLYITKDFIVTHNTTLAKDIAEILKIPFVSGSYSDLVPETRHVKHTDMIQEDAKSIYEKDFRLLSGRHKACKDLYRYISDRSYLDGAAYFIHKLSHRIAECETKDFIEKCIALTHEEATHIIFIPFTTNYIHNWAMEDNNKRVLNRYFQYEISSVMKSLLPLFGFVKSHFYSFRFNNTVGELVNEYPGRVKLMILNEMDYEKRLYSILKFLSW